MLLKFFISCFIIVLYLNGISLAAGLPSKKKHYASKKQEIIYSADDIERKGGDAREYVAQGTNGITTLMAQNSLSEIPRSMIIPGYQGFQPYLPLPNGHMHERTDLEGFPSEDAYSQIIQQENKGVGMFEDNENDLEDDKFGDENYREAGRGRLGRMYGRRRLMQLQDRPVDDDYEEPEANVGLSSFNEGDEPDYDYNLRMPRFQNTLPETENSFARSFGRFGPVRPDNRMGNNYHLDLEQEMEQEEARRRALESQREVMLESAIAQQKREQRMEEDAEMDRTFSPENDFERQPFYPEEKLQQGFDNIDQRTADGLQMNSFEKYSSNDLFPNQYSDETGDLKMRSFLRRHYSPDQVDKGIYPSKLRERARDFGEDQIGQSNFDFFPPRRQHHRRHRRRRKHKWNHFLNADTLPFHDASSRLFNDNKISGVSDSSFYDDSGIPKAHSSIETLTPAQAQYMEGKFSDKPSTMPMFFTKSQIPEVRDVLKNINLANDHVILKINGHYLEDSSELRSTIMNGKFKKGLGKLIKSKGPIKIKISHADDAKRTKIVDIISTSPYRVWDTRDKISKLHSNVINDKDESHQHSKNKPSKKTNKN